MKKLTEILILGLIFALTLLSQASAKDVLTSLVTELKIEIVTDISVTDLRAMMPPKFATSKNDGFIEIREFGYEWYPNNGEMKVAFLILVGLGDLGEKPVAIKLWAPLSYGHLSII